MVDRDEWKRLALAHVRRYERECDDAWHETALEIARQFLTQVEREDVSQADIAPLMVRAGMLPTESGADGLRSALYQFLSCALPPTNPRPFEPGDLVIGPCGDLCVVVDRTDRPSPSWLAAQDFEPMRTMSDARWWSAWPLRGGALAVPEPLLFSVGHPSDDQLLELLAHSSTEQVNHLVTIIRDLPKIVGR